MSKQPEKNKRSFWPLVNALTAPVAFLIIGYVVWASINAKPRVIQVGSEPTTTVIDLNKLAEESASASESATADGADWAKEEQPSDGSGSKEPAAPPSAEKLSATSNADESGTPSKEAVPDAPEQPASEATTEPASEPKPPKAEKPKVALEPAPTFYNVDVAKFLFEKKCSECHKLKRVENHTFADITAVEELIDKMVENGLEVNEKERAVLQYYVQTTFVD